MIIKAERVSKSIFGQKSLINFEIKINDELKYLSSMNRTSRLIGLPKGEGALTKVDGSICYMLLPSNEFGGAIERIIKRYSILDSSNQNCGAMYELKSGFLKSKYVIEYDKYNLSCYIKANGITENISIYYGEKQIAQIVKSVQIFENYYIFLLDEYINLEEILSLFILYKEFDDACHGRSAGKKGVSYTFDRNDKYYNKDWIKNNFKKEDVEWVNEQIQKERE